MTTRGQLSRYGYPSTSQDACNYQVIHTPSATIACAANSEEKVLRPSMESTLDVAAVAKVGKLLVCCAVELPQAAQNVKVSLQDEMQKIVITPNMANEQDEFFLLASFGRCKFRLTEDSVGQLLQVALGGSAKAFKVLHVQDRVFCFSLSSKKVGFFVYKLRYYQCDAFKRKKLQKKNWRQISKPRPQKSSSLSVLTDTSKTAVNHADHSVLTGANAVPINQAAPGKSAIGSEPQNRASVFDRIQFQKVSVFSRLNSEDMERNAREAISTSQVRSLGYKSEPAARQQKQKAIQNLEKVAVNKAGSVGCNSTTI
ncbi:hypothetical protein EJB05_05065, partial [Eragrostis curvula]